MHAFLGSYISPCDVYKITWFKSGGAAEALYKPENYEDLANFMQQKTSEGRPFFVMGAGTNLLIRDGGYRGVIIKLPFDTIRHENQMIIADAGALDAHVAKYALECGLGDVEFLSGIPGSIGGAVAMNAGCYGRELKDIFVSGLFMRNSTGDIFSMGLNDMGFSYRSCPAINGLTVLQVTLQGSYKDPAIISERMESIKKARRDAQPIGKRTCGSTFKNPSCDKAWRLIQEAGCANLRIGSAYVSEKHSNFIITEDGATAREIEQICDTIQKRVFEQCGVQLEREIVIIGQS